MWVMPGGDRHYQGFEGYVRRCSFLYMSGGLRGRAFTVWNMFVMELLVSKIRKKKQNNPTCFCFCGVQKLERFFLTNNPLNGTFFPVAGAGAVTLVYPLDMAYTCLAADHTQHRRFRGVWHVFGAIRREHGFFNLYRGLPLCCLVSISHQSI